MDGLKKRLNASLQFKLSWSLVLVILITAVVAGVFSFFLAFDEAHDLQDDTLRQMANLLSQQKLSEAGLDAIHLAESDEDTRVIVQRLGPTGRMRPAAEHDAELPLPPGLPEGFRTLSVDGETYRVLIKTTTSGEKIALAQETAFRDEIARDSALRTVTPFLVLVPLLVWVVANLVGQMFRPIKALSHTIDRRADTDLQPIDERDLPTEVKPFAVAINRLLERVARALEVQRRFVADAAHELRSPLTAMSLQAERLAEAEMSATAQQRLEQLQAGIARGRHLLEQLLDLSRVQSQQNRADRPAQPLALEALYRRVLEDLLPLAQAGQIDIGMACEQDALVWAHEWDMLALLRNLADNAIRYTPAGGTVDLLLTRQAGYAILSVRDNGPGIAPAERERIFDAFYRVLGSGQSGSGLGLSIVQTIVRRIGAEIALAYTDPAACIGLTVTIRIPVAGEGTDCLNSSH